MEKKIYDLTNSQKSIWMTEQFYNKTNINNIVGYLKIDKNTNFKALEQAFNYFVTKNDSFKLKIHLDESSQPKQYIDDFIYQNLEILDLKDNNQLLEFENSFPRQSINLLDNFLFLAKLLRLPNGSGILVLSAHHLISDAWTMSLCLEEIYSNYTKLINNEVISTTPNPSYLDYILSQEDYKNSEKYIKDAEFWKAQFKNLPNVISYKKNTNISINANRKVYTISPYLIKKIHSFCEENKISDYVFLLSVFSIYFKNVFNSNNFIIGNPVLNRSNFKEKKMTGMFVSIMPFIINCIDTNSFLEFCHTIANNQKQMYRHIKYPYHEILNNVRNTHNFSDSLYDIVFSYQNASIPSYCKWIHNHSQAESLQIHIKNIAEEKDILAIHYDYLTDLFSEQDIDLMHERILSIINQVLKTPTINLSNIDIISNLEKTLILKEFNNTNSVFNKTSNIVKEFEKIVNKYPNKIAVIDKNTSLTYQELNLKANFLAKKIIDLNINSNIIAFSLKRSSSIIVTILAILKSGHTYMPIDPDYPIDRINFMIKNSSCKLLISTTDFFEKVNCKMDFIDYNTLSFNRDIGNLNRKINFKDPCYVMYTSGSTGTPKAVTIMHYNVLNFVQSMQERLNYKPESENKILSVTTVCFDIFVFEVYPTLLSGLTLIIADELESRSPQLLSKIIKKHKISKILTTPSRIDLLFSDSKYLNSLSSIKEFILGGEPFPKTLLNKLKTHTKSKIYNLYGPTETTVYSTFKELTNCDDITIGKPINNTKIYILNDNNKLQPLNLIGEICIGGEGVGAGYYKNPEKTNQAFIPNPCGKGTLYKTGDLGYWQRNGELVCLGRKDSQVKIRGYRIELDDISNNILSFNNIEKCVVIDKTDKDDKKYLCAYLVSKKKIDISELKKYLVNLLPNYMIPTYFIQLESLPLTQNHKIDRKALPEPDTSDLIITTKYEKPSTKFEKSISKVFREVLNINRIGINDDIFDYNIDSLDIIRIQTKLLEYNIKLNTQDFYKYRTIKQLGELFENKINISEIEIDTDYLSTINNSFYKHKEIITYSKHEYKNILLIGSTGYLGIHLLEELLNTTKAHITCIIRIKQNENPIDRLANLYNFYFNKNLDYSRITIIDSNITKTNLGLNKSSYKDLCDSIDLVINTAANVRYYGNYSEFKKINVDLVENLINLCNSNNIKLVHISTLGVSGNYLVNHEKNYNSFCENDFYIGQKFDENVYIQTKFEAEKLIYEQIANGLNASIIRVGNLTSRYSDGIFQSNFADNAFYNILVMILKYHIMPNTRTEEFLEFTPIDYCAKAICTLISNVDINRYVFHLFNNNYICVSDLISIFTELGFETEVLSGNDFKEKILSLSNLYPEENILKGIVNDLDDTLGLSFKSTVNQQNQYTNSYLENLQFTWPIIDKKYIKKITNYLKKKKYI